MILPLTTLPYLAQQADPAAAQGGGYGFFFVIAAVFAIMYFVVIRPGQKEESERRRMLSALQKNDRVVTTSGIFGVVMNVKDDEVVLRIDETTGTKIRLQKSAISMVVAEPKDKADGEPQKS